MATPIFFVAQLCRFLISLRATNFCRLLLRIAPTITMSPPESTARTGAIPAMFAECVCAEPGLKPARTAGNDDKFHVQTVFLEKAQDPWRRTSAIVITAEPSAAVKMTHFRRNT